MPEETAQIGREHVHGSLRSYLILVVVVTVLIGVTVGMAIDYARERRVHHNEVLNSLREEAHALELARERIPKAPDFVTFVESYCDLMDQHMAPGHHIIVTNGSGEIVARRGHPAGHDLEGALLADRSTESIFRLGVHDVAQYRVHAADGATVIVAQYMDYIHDILRAQLVNRVLTAAAITLALMIVIILVVNRWVLSPLSRLAEVSHAWGGREFSARATPAGPRELRTLATEFNAMATDLEEHERENAAELERARRIQSNLLPTHAPWVAGLEIVAAYRPAQSVAGDLYDVFPLRNGRTAFVVLDVAGHGLPAALLTGVIKMSLHRRLAESDDLAQAMALVNQDMLDCAADDEFVTATVGIWDAGEVSWTWCAAGDTGGILLSEEGVRSLDSSGPLLGVMDTESWSVQVLKLNVGDRFYLFTDGVTDAGAPGNALTETGLRTLLEQWSGSSLKEQLQEVLRDVARRQGEPLFDDVTLLAVQVLGPPHTGSYSTV